MKTKQETMRVLGENGCSLYNMSLHETVQVAKRYNNWEITRVPGGWLYRSMLYNEHAVPPVFVPKSGEFI